MRRISTNPQGNPLKPSGQEVSANEMPAAGKVSNNGNGSSPLARWASLTSALQAKRGETTEAQSLFRSFAIPATPLATRDAEIENILVAWEKNSPADELENRHGAAIEIRNMVRKRQSDFDLRCKGLTELPNCFEKFTWLREVVVSGNKLTQLPKMPASLKYLRADLNQLTSLPAFAPGLTELYAVMNSLESLPELPPTLAILEVFSNKLTKLPKLPETLIKLSADDNLLRQLPELPAHLEDLTVSKNYLTEVPALPRTLKKLVVEHNQITALPVLTAALEIVIAAGNLLHRVPSLPPKLTHLSVSRNEIVELPELPASLKTLFASGNALKDLPIQVANLTQLIIDPEVRQAIIAALQKRRDALAVSLGLPAKFADTRIAANP